MVIILTIQTGDVSCACNVSFIFLKHINSVDLQRFHPEISCIPFDNATNFGHKKQTFVTQDWAPSVKHTKLHHFNNGVGCGYDCRLNINQH